MTRNSLFTVRDGKSDTTRNKVKNNIYNNNMKEKDLEKLTKSQLIKLLMETKNPSAQQKKPKNIIGLEYLMDEDPLPGVPDVEDSMEKSLRELRTSRLLLETENQPGHHENPSDLSQPSRIRLAFYNAGDGRNCEEPQIQEQERKRL